MKDCNKAFYSQEPSSTSSVILDLMIAVRRTNHLATQSLLSMVNFLHKKCLTKWHMQTVQTLISLLLKKNVWPNDICKQCRPRSDCSWRKMSDQMTYANSADPDQTAPEEKCLTKWHMQTVQTQIRLLLKKNVWPNDICKQCRPRSDCFWSKI